MCLYQTKLTTPENTLFVWLLMLFVWHPEIFHKYCLSFSWELKLPEEKLKTMLTQNFGVTNKEHYGVLWYFPGVVYSLMNATNVFQLFYYPMWIHPLSVICTVKFLFYV